jgi:hypothetical protein
MYKKIKIAIPIETSQKGHMVECALDNPSARIAPFGWNMDLGFIKNKRAIMQTNIKIGV